MALNPYKVVHIYLIHSGTNIELVNIFIFESTVTLLRIANKTSSFKDDILTAIWGYLELALSKMKDTTGNSSFPHA
jgi:hypothetical protein